MAISKVTLNGITLMDVTSDTVEANNLLSGNTATKNDGTKVTGSYTPVTPTYQTKTITPTTSSQTVTPDSNYDALSQVTVNAIPSQYIIPSGTLAVTENGTVDVTQYASADIAVPSSEPVLQEKTVTPTTSTQVITADSGGEITCIDEQNQQCYYVMTSPKRQYINLTWIEDLVVGETYHFYIVFDRRSYGGTQYYFVYDGDKEFTGFPMSFSLTSSTTSTRTDVLNLSATELYRDGVSDDDGTNYMTLTVTKQGQSYDGLSQVTVNPIPSEYVIPTGTLAVSQNGTVNVKNYEYANVNVEGGGGGTTVDDTLPVRFLDYDGTVVASYTAEDFANLTAMPSNPSHTGLTAQGWNWTLADAKAQVEEMGECDIGQMYITDDGKTRVYVELDEYTLHPYMGLCVNGTVEIDWGDNSSIDTLSGISLTSVVHQDHEYSSSGEYVIKITVTSGSFAIFGMNYTSHLFKKGTGTTQYSNDSYTNAVMAVELGSNVVLGNYAFRRCLSLKTITIPSGISIDKNTFSTCYSIEAVIIPSGITELNNNMFYSCQSLKTISIPLSVTSIGESVFNYCYGCSRIVLPRNVTSIGTYAMSNCVALRKMLIPQQCTNLGERTFYMCAKFNSINIPNNITQLKLYIFGYCSSLSKLVIPSSVTSILNYAFTNCCSMKEYHLLPTTPPTLNANAFAGIQSDCKIYVPAESLEAYQTATNWSTYADYMVGE